LIPIFRIQCAFAREAGSEHLAKHKTTDDSDTLFVQRHKTVLEKLSSMDVDNLTPIDAINLLNEIKKEISL